MPRFLMQPPPFAIATLNAIVGLVLPFFCALFLRALLVSWTENFRGREFFALSFAISAALVGLLACVGLAWATPTEKRKSGTSYLLVAASFAISAAIVVGGFPFRFGETAAPKFVIVLIVAACGAVMAWTMAIAARNFGANAYVPPLGVAVAGATVAGLSTGLCFALNGPILLLVLPSLWLAAVTFVCLTP